MRARPIEIASGLLVGLVLMGASLGATVVMRRLIEIEIVVEVEVRARASASESIHGEVAR